MDRAQRRPRKRHLGLGDRAGDPEVDDLDPPIRADQDVARLHVAVDETAGVGGGQRSRYPGADARGLAGRQWGAPSEDRRQVLTVDQLHDDVGTARVLSVVIDRDDVRVTERRGRLGLLPEAR